MKKNRLVKPAITRRKTARKIRGANAIFELATPEEWMQAFYDWARAHPARPADHENPPTSRSLVPVGMAV